MTNRQSDTASGSGGGLGARASMGMLWVSIALFFAKFLSFLSQIVLGHLLTVETYAVFGLAGTAVALVAGFQNSSVAKALIQNHVNLDELFPKYSAFAFQFGIVGMLILFASGRLFDAIYDVPGIWGVLLVTGLSIPFLALNTMLIATLSLDYRFRDINLIDIHRSLIYYVTLVGVALLGAEGYTIAIATLAGTLAAHLMYRKQSHRTPSYITLGLRYFINTFWTLRWVLLSGFLIALAMRSDFFMIGALVTAEQLGFYTFGFMLVASITLPITVGITQVFLPIFARMQDDSVWLRREFLRSMNAVVALGALLCLLTVGISSVLVDLIWDGKWNASVLVINLLLVAMPFRFMSTMSGVGFESLGKWRLRSVLLAIEALILMTFAGIGATIGGIDGAIVGVIAQRIFSAFVSVAFLGHALEACVSDLLPLVLRVFAPFLMCAGLLFLLSPHRHLNDPDLEGLLWATGETVGAVSLFIVMIAFLNRQIFTTLVAIVQKRLKSKKATDA